MSITSSVGLVGLSSKRGLGVGAHRRAPGGKVRALDQRRGDAETRQQLFDDIKTRTEQRLRRDDVIARLELAHQRGGDRRHAARGRARRLGAFEQRHAALEHRHRRIGEARIDEPRRVALEARLRLRHRVVEIALGEEQRLGGLLELRAHRAAVHELGGGTQRPGIAGLAGVGHSALLSWPDSVRTRAREQGATSGSPDLLALCLTWRQADRLK